ncbi:hypothetical protein D3Z47_02825 [Lachnospiraceae bacterium]|jgi:hypothetical protein|nr:hypothetical protein [Lachnospiraceae bacterium]
MFFLLFYFTNALFACQQAVYAIKSRRQFIVITITIFSSEVNHLLYTTISAKAHPINNGQTYKIHTNSSQSCLLSAANAYGRLATISQAACLQNTFVTAGYLRKSIRVPNV